MVLHKERKSKRHMPGNILGSVQWNQRTLCEKCLGLYNIINLQIKVSLQFQHSALIGLIGVTPIASFLGIIPWPSFQHSALIGLIGVTPIASFLGIIPWPSFQHSALIGLIGVTLIASFLGIIPWPSFQHSALRGLIGVTPIASFLGIIPWPSFQHSALRGLGLLEASCTSSLGHHPHQ